MERPLPAPARAVASSSGGPKWKYGHTSLAKTEAAKKAEEAVKKKAAAAEKKAQAPPRKKYTPRKKAALAIAPPELMLFDPSKGTANQQFAARLASNEIADYTGEAQASYSSEVKRGAKRNLDIYTPANSSPESKRAKLAEPSVMSTAVGNRNATTAALRDVTMTMKRGTQLQTPRLAPVNANSMQAAKRTVSTAGLDNVDLKTNIQSKRPRLSKGKENAPVGHSVHETRNQAISRSQSPTQTEPFPLFDPDHSVPDEEPRVAQPGEFVMWSDFESTDEEDPDSEDDKAKPVPVPEPLVSHQSKPLDPKLNMLNIASSQLDESLGFRNHWDKAVDLFIEEQWGGMRERYGPRVPAAKIEEKLRRMWPFAPISDRMRCLALGKESEREFRAHNENLREIYANARKEAEK